MRAFVSFLSMALVLSFVIPVEAGSLSGTILLPPPKKERKFSSKYDSGLRPKPAPPDPSAVVYLEPDSAVGEIKAPETPVAMRQRDYRFVPSVLPVLVGSRVSFPNDDPDYHNVFSYSKAKAFDLGRYRKNDEVPVIHFDKPGEVKLFCEIHRHMRGVILVLETPYFAATDHAGSYTIADVPAGSYTLHIWFKSKMLHTQRITIGSGAESIDFNGSTP